MKTFHKTLVTNHSVTAIYGVIADVEKYPKFIRWCDKIQILEANEVEQSKLVQLDFSFGPVHKHFTTKNTYVTNQSIQMDLVEGPFKTLYGKWLFTELELVADGTARTEVDFFMQFELKNRILAMSLKNSFNDMATSFIDTFIQRLEETNPKPADKQ